MATATAQRVGIWIIAIVLTVGTIGSFVAIILGNDNQRVDQARMSELSNEYQTAINDYQTKVNEQAQELSNQYFAEFNHYASRPAGFDAASVTELSKEDVKIGNGEEITASSSFTAYYIGWNPTGQVFDGSIEGSTLKPPLYVSPGGVITGWSEGLVGMKVGGVRQLTIPASMAYGEQGSGDMIPPNTPLKFVVMIIPTPEQIPYPEPPAELLKYYGN